MSIVTRFAPSPTGYLHVGGVRTALFAWLFAKRHGGKFLIRIEDTDKERSTPDAIRAILDGMAWMDLKSDQPITFQSNNIANHQAVAQSLLDNGNAYRDYTTPEEMEGLKEAHRLSGTKGPFRYASPYRDLQDVQDLGDLPFVVRFKSPRTGETIIDDLVQGQVKVHNSELDDFIILRTDGTPTYMLAAVVDDYDSGVTHVIRGDDHLNNAFRQLPIYQAMNWPLPVYAHLPLIFGEDGKKLSKRNGAPGLAEYRDDKGILPEVMFNYLIRLGWGHGDDEIISRKQALLWFDLKDVNRAPARVNEKKLRHLSGHYIREATDDRLLDQLTQSQFIGETIRPALSVLKVRASNMNELRESTRFLLASRPIDIDDQAKPELDLVILRDMYDLLLGGPWDREQLDHVVKAYVEAKSLTMREVSGALRVALTGKKTSPPTTDVMLLLGMEETTKRLWDLIK